MKPRALHPCERKYLLATANGLTAQEVAASFGVSYNTVVSVLKEARFALDARNIAHAVALAIVHGEFSKADLKESLL